MSIFRNLFKKKEILVFAEPFQDVSPLESVSLAGAGSAIFMTVLPIVSSGVGAWLACTTSGCATFASAVGGFAAGSSSAATTAGFGTYLYYKRYKKWSIKNAGKYVIKESGRLEKVIPIAFITPTAAPIAINPVLMIVLVNIYYCASSYLRTKKIISASKSLEVSKK